MSKYDSWRCQSPDDEREERERACGTKRDFYDLVDEIYQRWKDGDLDDGDN